MNKAIQRSLTKACARHGLGLYIYAGEDLPEGDENAPQVGSELASQKQIDLIFNLLRQKNLYLKQFGITSTQGLTKNQASELINRIGAYQPPKPTITENDDLPFWDIMEERPKANSSPTGLARVGRFKEWTITIFTLSRVTWFQNSA